MVLRARAYILRLSAAAVHDLVPSEWAARAVLRYWRLQRRGGTALRVLQRYRRRPSVTLIGHTLVLTLGFVMAVPAMSPRSAPRRPIAAQHSSYGISTSSARQRNST